MTANTSLVSSPSQRSSYRCLVLWGFPSARGRLIAGHFTVQVGSAEAIRPVPKWSQQKVCSDSPRVRDPASSFHRGWGLHHSTGRVPPVHTVARKSAGVLPAQIWVFRQRISVLLMARLYRPAPAGGSSLVLQPGLD